MRLLFEDRQRRFSCLGSGTLELTEYSPHSQKATVMVAGKLSMTLDIDRLTPLRPTVGREIITPLVGPLRGQYCRVIRISDGNVIFSNKNASQRRHKGYSDSVLPLVDVISVRLPPKY